MTSYGHEVRGGKVRRGCGGQKAPPPDSAVVEAKMVRRITAPCLEKKEKKMMTYEYYDTYESPGLYRKTSRYIRLVLPGPRPEQPRSALVNRGLIFQGDDAEDQLRSFVRERDRRYGKKWPGRPPVE